MTYLIRRVYRDDRPAEVVKTGLTLEEARAHCSDPATQGDGWFDTYVEEDSGPMRHSGQSVLDSENRLRAMR